MGKNKLFHGVLFLGICLPLHATLTYDIQRLDHDLHRISSHLHFERFNTLQSKYIDHYVYQFLSGTGPDNTGKTIQEVLKYTPKQLESNHDFIQRIFPIYEQSGADPDAPYLSQSTDKNRRNIPGFKQNELVEVLKSNNQARANLTQAFIRMLEFYGFTFDSRNPAKLIKSENWQNYSANWLRSGNHNFLRLDRMIKSLGIFGFYHFQCLLFDQLEELYMDKTYRPIIARSYQNYWLPSYNQYKDPQEPNRQVAAI